jgi:hypothetical protein
MKRKSYIDKVLNFLNNDYNRETYPKSNFDLFDGIEKFVRFLIKNDIISNYGIEEGSEEYVYLIESWIRKNYGNGDEALFGDTVVLKEMPDDPNPIEKGTKGKIIDINTVLTFGEDHLIVHWENGRKINLLRGFDKYDVIQNIGNKFLNLTIKGY